MPNHPNRNWRKKWSVDADQLTATHTLGLVVFFSPVEKPTPTPNGCVCWTTDGRLYQGSAQGVEELAKDLLATMTVAQAEKRLARLLREAGEVMAGALNGKT